MNYFAVGGFSLSQLIATLFPCYYCTEFSTVIDDLRIGIFHSSEWFSSDLKSRKLVHMLLQSTMNSVELRVLEIIKLNLETFSNIVNTAYSLYALFSKLG